MPKLRRLFPLFKLIAVFCLKSEIQMKIHVLSKFKKNFLEYLEKILYNQFVQLICLRSSAG